MPKSLHDDRLLSTLCRPATDRMTFTRDEVGLCAVCRHALERVTDLYSR